MNNMEFSEKYLRRPVIVPSTDEVIGEIGVPLFDRKTGRMEWILIKEPAPKKGTLMLEAQNIISVDENEILVTPGPNMLYEYTQNMGEGSLRKKTIQLIGRDAIDEGGIKIGTVSGVEVDSITLLLTSIIVVNSGGAMEFGRNKFYLGRDKVIIGRRKADIWTETISYEAKEVLQEKRKQEKQEKDSLVKNDKAEKIDINDCANISDLPCGFINDGTENAGYMKKKPLVEEDSLEGVRQRLNTLSSKIMRVVENDNGTAPKKDLISAMLSELNGVKARLDGINDNDCFRASAAEDSTRKTVDLQSELAENQANEALPMSETNEERKKTRQIKRITISSLFFPKEDADRIQVLDGYFQEGDVELKYPKGYEKRQKKLAAKKDTSVGKIIFSQIFGGTAFAVVYYVLTLLKMI